LIALITGSVGPPLSCNFLKLVDVPEYDYYVSNNQGEVSTYHIHFQVVSL